MKLSDLYKEVYLKSLDVGDTVTAYKCIFRIREELSCEDYIVKNGEVPFEIEFRVKEDEEHFNGRQA